MCKDDATPSQSIILSSIAAGSSENIHLTLTYKQLARKLVDSYMSHVPGRTGMGIDAFSVRNVNLSLVTSVCSGAYNQKCGSVHR